MLSINQRSVYDYNGTCINNYRRERFHGGDTNAEEKLQASFSY